MDKETSNSKLMSTLQFNSRDLTMNRQGKLTSSQIEKLKNGMFDPSKWSKFIIGLMVGGLLLLLVRDGAQAFILPVILGYFAFCTIFYFLFSLYFKNNAKKLEEGKYPVETFEGIVTVNPESKASSAMSMSQYGGAITMGEKFSGINLGANAYMIEINDKKLYTTKEAQEAFQNGKKYRICVLRTSQQEHQNALVGAIIVSAELMNGEKELY